MKTQPTQILLTKFFYSGNHLHFQILIQTEFDLINYGEYRDYTLYKEAFDQIQQTINNQTRIIRLADNNINVETTFANVA